MINYNIRPVFIVGAARSGSRIYLSLFNHHTEIDMIEEPHILNPKWLHPDFIRSIKKLKIDLSNDKDVNLLVDFMFSNYFYGYFWESINLDKEKLRYRILNGQRSCRDIFAAVMEESRIKNGKLIPGAKYPVHFSFIPTLRSWFPDCKIVHIVRDPRAFFASQIYKYARGSNFSQKSKRLYLYFPMLLHTIIQFSWSVKTYERYKNYDNYYLSKYEDIVSSPERSIINLCEFLDIPFSKSYLQIPVIDSSHNFKSTHISDKSLNLWKKRIPLFIAALIKICSKKYMQKLNYS